MKSYKISLESLEETLFSNLIAVHSQLEGFKLVYLLNEKLKISLSRVKEDFVPYEEKEMAFVYYKWTENQKEVFLYNNKQLSSVESKKEELFSDSSFCENYLFPEYRQVDYIIKAPQGEEDKIHSKIKEIKEIKMTYIIKSNQIKSKSILAII